MLHVHHINENHVQIISFLFYIVVLLLMSHYINRFHVSWSCIKPNWFLKTLAHFLMRCLIAFTHKFMMWLVLYRSAQKFFDKPYIMGVGTQAINLCTKICCGMYYIFQSNSTWCHTMSLKGLRRTLRSGNYDMRYWKMMKETLLYQVPFGNIHVPLALQTSFSPYRSLCQVPFVS